jgi:hypothetical protein
MTLTENKGNAWVVQIITRSTVQSSNGSNSPSNSMISEIKSRSSCWPTAVLPYFECFKQVIIITISSELISS